MLFSCITVLEASSIAPSSSACHTSHAERSRFWLQEALPAGLQVLRVRAGVAVLGSPALFEARLTLVPAPDEDVVLARCGASSGPASSPAPSGAATTQVRSRKATRASDPMPFRL
jgi:hypothetical protein